MTTLTQSLRGALLATLAVTAAAPVLAGPYNRQSVPDYVEDYGTIRVGDVFGYDFLGFAGGRAFVELGSDQGRADLDVTVYDDQGRIIAQGISGFSEESLSWFVDRDTLYYIEVTSFEGAVTDFYLEAWTEWGH